MVEDRLHYSAANCSLARTLEVVGERWTMLVIREALLGLTRFDDFRQAIGCARNVLAARLATLVEAGVLARVPYRQPGMRERFEYRLTEKGRELSTAVVALMRWGDRHLADAAGPPLEIVHAICGEKMRARLSCERHGLVPPSSVTVRIGPGAKRLTGGSDNPSEATPAGKTIATSAPASTGKRPAREAERRRESPVVETSQKAEPRSAS